jgi:hypothetical protein
MDGCSYLGELPPIQVVSGIKLEYENVINLSAHPDATIDAEEEEKKQRQKVACVDLPDD